MDTEDITDSGISSAMVTTPSSTAPSITTPTSTVTSFTSSPSMRSRPGTIETGIESIINNIKLLHLI